MDDDTSGRLPASAVGSLRVVICASLLLLILHACSATAEARATARCMGKPATIVTKRHVVKGTAHDDVIVLRAPRRARVDGRAGDDLICGGRGRDRIAGGAGDDVLRGGAGRDVLVGGVGADRFVRGRGDRVRDLGAGDRVNGRRQGNIIRPRQGSVAIPASAVAPGTGGSTVILDRGRAAPRVGAIVVVPIGPDAPEGALGRVRGVDRRAGGETRISLTPVALDEAYSRFSARRSGTLEKLARGRLARSAGLKPKFSCSGSGLGPVVEVEVDLSKLRFTAELDTAGPSIFVLLTGSPQFSLDFAFQGKVTCRLSTDQPAIFIPVAGPLGVALRPAFSFDVGGKFGGKFTWAPRMTVGFLRSRTSGNYDVTVFKSAGNVSVYGEASAEAFLGMTMEASVGGRIGIGGSVGPVLSARGSVSSAGRCFEMDVAARAQLSASAHVFFADWHFALFTVTFGRYPIIPHRCTPLGGNPDDPSGGGGDGGGGDDDGSGPPDDDSPPNPPPPVRLPALHPGYVSAHPTSLTALGDRVAFFDNGPATQEIWVTDGTTAGSARLMAQNINNGDFRELVSVGSSLYWVVRPENSGAEVLWRSNGTVAGTAPVKSFPWSTGEVRYVLRLTAAGNRLFFLVANQGGGLELWRSDGTAVSTVLVKDFGEISSDAVTELVHRDGLLYFSLREAGEDAPIGLWTSDGTTAGTRPVIEGFGPTDLYAAPDRVYFRGWDADHGGELWASDGTPTGTAMVVDWRPGADDGLLGDDIVYAHNDGRLYYSSRQFHPSQLRISYDVMVTDGTATGTRRIADSGSSLRGMYYYRGNPLVAFGSGVVFGGDFNQPHRYEDVLLRAGPMSESPDVVYTEFRGPYFFTVLGNWLYFSADSPDFGTELWRSDGTTAGTVRVTDLRPGYSSSSPSELTVAGRRLYFAAQDAQGGGIWSVRLPSEGG
jgi:ELWxxDGT repeat protein